MSRSTSGRTTSRHLCTWEKFWKKIKFSKNKNTKNWIICCHWLRKLSGPRLKPNWDDDSVGAEWNVGAAREDHLTGFCLEPRRRRSEAPASCSPWSKIDSLRHSRVDCAMLSLLPSRVLHLSRSLRVWPRQWSTQPFLRWLQAWLSQRRLAGCSLALAPLITAQQRTRFFANYALSCVRVFCALPSRESRTHLYSAVCSSQAGHWVTGNK